jgi:hypothetical protein
MEGERPGGGAGEHPIEGERVNVHVQVEPAAEALAHGHGRHGLVHQMRDSLGHAPVSGVLYFSDGGAIYRLVPM